jgi:mycothiol synthase
MDAHLPQLRMRRPTLTDLPRVQIAAPFELRCYQPGDEAAWAAIMNTGIGTDWTAERCRRELTRLPHFDPAGLFFATAGGEPIGTACSWSDFLPDVTAGWVHMVCVRPEHRGHGLGYQLTLQVLHRLHDRGFANAWLDTDDFRLPAIRAYLALGFEPVLTHPSHPDRWRAVRALLTQAGR